MPALPDFGSYLDLARSHLPLTLLAVSLLFALFTLTVVRRPESAARIVDVLFRSYLFWTVALLFLYQATVAGAFGPQAMAAINAPVVTLQPDAAYASLAFAVVALLALVRSAGLRFAAVIGPAIYMLAPLAVAELNSDTIAAYAPQLAVVAVGLALVVLQMGAGRVAVIRHRALEA
jgi:hypothetical protein